MERQIDLLDYQIKTGGTIFSWLEKACRGIPHRQGLIFINQQSGCSRLPQGQAAKEARTLGQDFKVQIYLALRYDHTIKFIESIKDNEL